VKYFILLICALITAPTIAADAVQKKLALEYLIIMDMPKQIDSSIDAYEAELGASLKIDKAKFKAALEASVGWNATKDQMVDLTANTYTKEELAAYIAFAQTPIGKAFNAKNAAFTKGYTELASANLLAFMQKNAP
jgi:Uncharacterized protein conserved in bacteria (DUF2059)